VRSNSCDVHHLSAGQRFPTLAGARSRILVDSCYFVNNTCTNNTRCHTPGIYVSEGERLTVTNTTCAALSSKTHIYVYHAFAGWLQLGTSAACRFKGNRGNLAGALMITAGAVAVVSNNTFIQVGHVSCERATATASSSGVFAVGCR
jgi:hypothetical protein